MNDMTKMFKCKLCGSKEFIDHTVYHTNERLFLKSETINVGVLGNVKISNYISMNREKGFHLVTDIERGDLNVIDKMELEITHCPFCGRDLDD